MDETTTPLSDVPVAPDVLATPSEGLKDRAQPPKRVVVIGAGIAGLVAAFELGREGHEVVVLEGQDRVGGRIYTLRTFAPGLYAEAGAMRIPRIHDLTIEYCKLFGLELRPFVMSNPKGLVYIGGRRMTAEEAQREPERLPFEVAERERGKTADALWEAATADIRELLATRSDAWEEIRRRYDEYSIREFLELKGFSESAIEMYGVLNFVEADLNSAVMEELREQLGGAYVDMQEVAGGADRLPNAFYAAMPDKIRFGAEVHAIDQDPDSVTVHYRTRAGRYSVTADYAVCTLPFPVLRHVEMLKPLSRGKQRAIRQLHYSASTKILFQVRRRFWEQEDGIFGGATATDLGIRRINYPTPDPNTERGVLLASYTWGQDAARWGAMDEPTRIEEALEDVEQIHPRIREEFEIGASHAWSSDKYAGGAFALFEPEQQTKLHDDIVRREGRILFAGEHCSLHHAWIQGALESGIRAAREIHEASAVMSPQASTIGEG